jgi:hypothetical protein
MSCNEAKRQSLQMNHEEVENVTAIKALCTAFAFSRPDASMDLDHSSQEESPNIDHKMQDTHQSEGDRDEKELDDGLWDDLYEDVAEAEVKDGREQLVPSSRMEA